MRRERYLANGIAEDLEKRMVFVGGPRQVGKTTLALSFLEDQDADETHPAYLNWDALEDRQKLLQAEIPSNQSLIILDEIHKYKPWRNLVKGFYDKNKSHIAFIVTGSARLDHYRRGGDSLQGRYHYYRLHPFSIRELDVNPNADQFEQLLQFGGFPEPLFEGQKRFHRRWLREYTARVIHDDLRDLEQMREISLMDHLVSHLPSCVGSPLSVNSLRTLVQVAHQTMEHWLCILERLYVCFRISPFGADRIRAVKKEQKLYFWDWSRVQDPGARFENMVACQLLKYCHFMEDTEGFDMDLRYVRDTDKREVDFVVLQDGHPLFAVESKLGDTTPSPSCRYFRERTPIPAFYQVHSGTRDFGRAETDVRVLPFLAFCIERSMP